MKEKTINFVHYTPFSDLFLKTADFFLVTFWSPFWRFLGLHWYYWSSELL